MNKVLLATGIALASMSATANAADLDPELGLIVSGVVDQWVGVQYIDDGYTDDTVFATGTSGLLSLPLGENLSIQSDVKYETNDRAFDSLELPLGPRYSYQGAVHLSWRDPSSGLFGLFGGMGTSNQAQKPEPDMDYRFVGGEGQVYLNDMTFYVQGGYVDFANGFGSGGNNLNNNLNLQPAFYNALDEGLFVRGVWRWFVNETSRLQLEGTYLNADFESMGSMDAFSVGARYDFALEGMPILGNLPLYIAYRGTFRDGCGNFVRGAQPTNFDLDDHTFMIGTSYSFSGSLLNVDRHGATLDTPDFNYNCTGPRYVMEEALPE